MFSWHTTPLVIASIFILLICILKIIFFFGSRARIFFPFPSLYGVQKQQKNFRSLLFTLSPYIKLLAVIFLLLGFIRIQTNSSLVQLQREGIAIQILVDRSSSMKQVMNYKGKNLNRLDTVKAVFQDFLLGDGDNLQGRQNDLVGLGTFAGFLEENVPLTLDHFTLIDFLKDVKLAQRYEDGTFIGDAVYQSVLRLLSVDQFLAGIKQGHKIKSKIIVLLTDGQHTKGSFPPLESAEFAKENNIKIYTIAITGQENIKSSASLVFPVLDTSILEEMAKITGGFFSRASSGESLKAIYEKIDKLEKSKIADATLMRKEWFPLFLKIGVLLFLLHLFLKYFVIRKIP